MADDLLVLIAAVARADMVAFERLYRATSSKLLGVSLRIVGDRQLAEDVVQDAYVKVWQGAGSYSAEAGRPMTWLITIARNQAIDMVRRRRSGPQTVPGDVADVLANLGDPRDRETDFVEADRLATCLGRLEQPQRDCFVLAYVEGRSRDELASRFGRPVNTIKTWLHRSAGALRACLAEA